MINYWKRVWRQEDNVPSKDAVFFNALIIFAWTRAVFYIISKEIDRVPVTIGLDIVSLIILVLLLFMPTRSGS